MVAHCPELRLRTYTDLTRYYGTAALGNYCTSAKKWTNDFIGYEWLARTFQPMTVFQDANQQHLLIIEEPDNHV